MDAVRSEERIAERSATPAPFKPLPAEAPLEMPVQSLRRRPARSDRRRTLPSSPRRVFLRRAYVLGGTVALTAGAANEMYRVLEIGGVTPLEWLILALFVALFAWIAFSFVSALAGFVVLLSGGERRLGIDPTGPLPEPDAPTALLMPVYNEDPARVTASLQAIYESLAATGRIDRFAIFILSDTTDPDAWIAEEAAYLDLLDRTGGHGRIFYRRRPHNVERKAGNISSWVKRFGGGYPQMLILDADSVMDGGTIVRLAAALERNADVGLIQTLPIIVNGNTVFARLQQFAGRVYGPLIAHGIAWWHGAEGNYWGHNAIIRTRAFAEQAGLPHLRGRKPFGGHIMSHDFVEAALLRRGGWAVHMVPELQGSYEEGPPSLSDIAVRDRRWCQGNLQHAAVLPGRGLHWVSRLHLMTGIGSYATAPMWLLFLLLGVAVALQARFVPPEYFSNKPSLFPLWPAQDPVRSMWVFVGTMGILLLPKLLGYVAAMTRRAERRGCGGVPRAFISLLFETVITGLMAPVTMLIQSVGLISILLGRDRGWHPQRRDDGSIPFREVVRRYAGYTIFGLVLGFAAYLVALPLLLWMSPVVLGLALAIPLVAFTAASGPGRTLRQWGVLGTPEETQPPPVLARQRELQASTRGNDAADGPREAVLRLARDERLRAAHMAMLPPPRRPRRDPIDEALLIGLVKVEEAGSLQDALAALATREKAAVLADRRGVERLLALSAL